VSQETGNKARSANFSPRSLLRSVGRVGIWIVLGILLVRGLGAVLTPSHASAPPARVGSVAAVDQASSALAVRFARTYLDDPSSRVLTPFLAEGAKVRSGRPPADSGPLVAQAEVSATQELGDGREILTVACELRDARVLYLAVPISRSGAGEVAVMGAPWIVAAPGVAGVAAVRPRPLAGPDAAAIGALVEKFIPAYVSARTPSDLSYLLAPGAGVVPLAGSLDLLGAPGAPAQLGDGEGRRRTVIVACRLRDPASGAVYRLAYRLGLLRRDRWYVQAVEGTLS
jgi:hypothetical protein